MRRWLELGVGAAALAMILGSSFGGFVGTLVLVDALVPRGPTGVFDSDAAL